jgi:hypothetical protein
MKKKLPDARSPLPKFESDREVAEYFDRHPVAPIWDELLEAEPAKLSAPLAQKINERRARREALSNREPPPADPLPPTA